MVLLSAVTVCEEVGEPSGLSHHCLWLWNWRGNPYPCLVTPGSLSISLHAPVISLIRVQPNPQENLMFTAFYSLRPQGSCLLLVQLRSTQKSCPFGLWPKGREIWAKLEIEWVSHRAPGASCLSRSLQTPLLGITSVSLAASYLYSLKYLGSKSLWLMSWQFKDCMTLPLLRKS